MHRGLLPTIFICLGYTIILLATLMPILEWQVSDVTSDLPSTFEVRTQPSPWQTRLGDSLDHGIYVSIGKFHVFQNGKECSLKDTKYVVKRSPKDEALERVMSNIDKNMLWLIIWILGEFILSIIYIWCFALWYRHPIWDAVGFSIVFTLIAVAVYNGVTQILRVLLPRVAPLVSAGILDCYNGTITFTATLSKIHYESMGVFLVGVLLEVGALGIMVNQVIRAIAKRNGAPS